MENEYEVIPETQMPHATVIQAGELLVLSKTNATEFHQKMRQMIFDTGIGLFEYLEVLKFFENVNKCVKGDSNARIPEDAEFIQLVRDELSKYEKGKYLTPRGVKFETAETGTTYDFSQCGDVELSRKEAEAEVLNQWIKNRKELLKTLTEPTTLLDEETGEAYKVLPPIKKSKSSYKITLAR